MAFSSMDFNNSSYVQCQVGKQGFLLLTSALYNMGDICWIPKYSNCYFKLEIGQNQSLIMEKYGSIKDCEKIVI